YSRTTTSPTSQMYSASGAVLVMELVKLLICSVVLILLGVDGSGGLDRIRETWEVVKKNVRSRDTLKMVVPSGIYAVQ
ncbi:hypothetical protein HK097_006903, partial [Rhizophlyctis rosea]